MVNKLDDQRVNEVISSTTSKREIGVEEALLQITLSCFLCISWRNEKRFGAAVKTFEINVC